MAANNIAAAKDMRTNMMDTYMSMSMNKATDTAMSMTMDTTTSMGTTADMTMGTTMTMGMDAAAGTIMAQGMRPPVPIHILSQNIIIHRGIRTIAIVKCVIPMWNTAMCVGNPWRDATA